MGLDGGGLLENLICGLCDSLVGVRVLVSSRGLIGFDQVSDSFEVLLNLALLYLVIFKFFRDVEVAIVLLVVKEDVIVKYHSFSVHSVLVPLLDVKGDPLSRRVISDLYKLALSVLIRSLFGVLQKHARINMS